MKNWFIKNWWYVLVVSAFVAAYSWIQVYDWDRYWGLAIGATAVVIGALATGIKYNYEGKQN